MTIGEQQLLDDIAAAFAGVTLEDGISLNMAKYIDCHELHPEYLEEAKHDERVDWKAISDEVLEKCDTTFCFVDTKGYRFYIPAYMSWAIRKHRSDTKANIGDHTVYSLNPTGPAFFGKSFADCFSDTQILVMKRFLELAIESRYTLDARVAAENLVKFQEALGAPRVRRAKLGASSEVRMTEGTSTSESSARKDYGAVLRSCLSRSFNPSTS